MIEVHTPLLEGYAGFYDSATDEITISEDLDDATIVHEASHAWFNSGCSPSAGSTRGWPRSTRRGSCAALGRGYPAPDPVSAAAKVAFPLEDWPPPAPIGDEESDAREQYGYDASLDA